MHHRSTAGRLPRSAASSSSVSCGWAASRQALRSRRGDDLRWSQQLGAELQSRRSRRVQIDAQANAIVLRHELDHAALLEEALDVTDGEYGTTVQCIDDGTHATRAAHIHEQQMAHIDVLVALIAPD